ncbi:heavy-metal-associated domain-containing protein [Pelagibius sp.]|uniref:heavy-metal-associated domain-containing protein n=1 Tax=Pelagibius sp. TaxID=1931238 RepID=UPI003BAF78F4
MQTFVLQGITCNHCVTAITRAVQDIDPKARVSVETSTGKVDVESRADRAVLIEAMEKAGCPLRA